MQVLREEAEAKRLADEVASMCPPLHRQYRSPGRRSKISESGQVAAPTAAVVERCCAWQEQRDRNYPRRG